jgi:hypothetical protein
VRKQTDLQTERKKYWQADLKTDGQSDRHTYIYAGRQTARQTNIQANKQTDRYSDRQTDRQKGRQTGRQKGKQSESNTNRNADIWKTGGQINM